MNNVILTDDEKAAYKAAIIESIKLISEASEGIQIDNYPVISELCSLYQKLDN